MKFLNKHFFAGVLVGSVLTVVVVVGGAVVLSLSWVKHHGDAMVGAAPEFPESGPVTTLRAGQEWSLQDLNGAPVSLEAERGKVIFLNKWGTWCDPCVAELPSIEALYDSLNSEGVFFALVSEEDPAKVRAFVAKRGLRAPVYVTKQKAPDAYQSMGIPATYILDRSWNVVAEHIGSANWDVDRCRRYLRRLLAR